MTWDGGRGCKAQDNEVGYTSAPAYRRDVPAWAMVGLLVWSPASGDRFPADGRDGTRGQRTQVYG